jgi:carboxypeptidase PM20D1
MAMPLRAVFANFWLFEGLVKKQLTATPATAAQVRTTTAPTMLSGSVQENILPAAARAVVNFRILPGDSIQGVLRHVRQIIDDPTVTVRIYPGMTAEPSPISATDSPAFGMLQRTIRQVYPEAVVAPGLMIGASDARLYADVSRDVYRFVPLVVASEDLARVHGTNERMPVEDYARIVRFYRQLLENWGK